MKKIKKVLAVFLSLLTIMSIFSINVSAEFVGVPGSIGSADSGESSYNIYSGGLGANYYVVGYRFSIVTPSGVTLMNSDNTKFRIIDLIRFGDNLGNGNYWGASDGHTNVLAYNGSLMEQRKNKFQWNSLYRNNGEMRINRVSSRGSAGTNTFGLYYAKTVGSTGTYKPVQTRLPATSGVETWTDTIQNRKYLLQALGYSGATEANAKDILGNNRIVIEPLYRVKWDGTYTLFSATDLAVMGRAYENKDSRFATGPSYIRNFSHRDFQQALWADENLRMPADVPLNVPTPKTSGHWTNDQILKNTLGMAFYYNTPTSKVNVRVKYKTIGLGGSLPCTQDKGHQVGDYYYSQDANGFVTRSTKKDSGYGQFIQVWKPYAINDLISPTTAGLTPPGGYKWNTVNGYYSWRLYSFNSTGKTTYWYRQSEKEELNSESLWGKNYWSANVTSSDGSKIGTGWRYSDASHPTRMKSLNDYKNDVEVWAYPDLTTINVNVKYKITDINGKVVCKQDVNHQSGDYAYSHDSNGFVTRQNVKTGSDYSTFIHSWNIKPDFRADLIHPSTAGLTPADGYKWNNITVPSKDKDGNDITVTSRAWRMYSYNKDTSTNYFYRQCEADNIDTGSLWGRCYTSANVVSSNGKKPTSGVWRYDAKKDLKHSLWSYTNDVEVLVYPDVSPTVLTINYNPNGGTGSIDSQTAHYDEKVTLSDGSGFSREGYTLVGWTVSGKVLSYKLSHEISKAQLLNSSLKTEDCSVTLNAVWRKNDTDINVKVKYRLDLGNLKCTLNSSEYGFDSNGFITKDNSVLTQLWTENGKGNLFAPTELGLKAPVGYRWNTITTTDENGQTVVAPSWRLYSYNQDASVNYYYSQSEAQEIPTIDLWERNYYSANVTSSDGSVISSGWRYDSSGDLKKSLSEYKNDVEVIAFPDLSPYTLTVHYDADGGTGSIASQENIIYNQSVTLSDGSGLRREGYRFDGWSTEPSVEGFIDLLDYRKSQVVLAQDLNRKLATEDCSITLYAVWTPILKVNYDANGGTGSVPSQESEYGENITLSNGTEGGGIRKEGHKLIGWAIAPNGDVAYSLSQVKKAEDLAKDFGKDLTYQSCEITLYAVWEEINTTPVLTINYEPNGGTGSIPSQMIEFNKVATLSDGSGFSREAYKLVGWSDTTDGDVKYKLSVSKLSQAFANDFGKDLSAGDCSITLYAVWKPNKLTINYEPNADNVRGTIAPQIAEYGKSVTLNKGDFTRDGYKLIGWATTAEGNVTYSLSQKFEKAQDLNSALATQDCSITLYAVWKPYVLTISYNPNGGEGTINPQTAIFNQEVTLSNGSAFTRDGHRLVGWSTTPTGNTQYNLSQKALAQELNSALATSDCSVTLYAVWTPNKLTITYDSNNGTGDTATQTAQFGENVELYGEDTFTWNGVLIGWSTTPTGGVEYSLSQVVLAQELNNELITSDCSITLYAVWKPTKIRVNLDSVIVPPTNFVDSWFNPTGTKVKVTVQSSAGASVYKQEQLIVIPESGALPNFVEFKDMPLGSYSVRIECPGKDFYYENSGESASTTTITLNKDNTDAEWNRTLHNNTHTISVEYTNQFNERLDEAEFTITLYENGEPSDTIVVRPDENGKISITVPAVSPSGVPYTYTTEMTKAPENYELDVAVIEPFSFPTDRDAEEIFAFHSWYIWDFSVKTELTASSAGKYNEKKFFEKGETFDLLVTAKNLRNHKNVPNVTIEVYLNDTLLKTESVAINANGTVEYTIPVNIPTDMIEGIQSISAYINYDKYSEYGEDFLYETQLIDNTSSLEFNVGSDGELRIAPIRSNGNYAPKDVVFASFYVYNDKTINVLKENGVKVKGELMYTAIGGAVKTIPIGTIENVVIPNRNYVDNRNLVYFKFVVPDDIFPFLNCAVIATIVDGDKENKAALIKPVVNRPTSNTPYLGRALKAPNGMLSECGRPNLTKYPAKSTSYVVGNEARWNEWVETADKKLELRSYNVKAGLDATVKIDNRCLTAAYYNKNLFFKSAYAITLAVQPKIDKSSTVTDAMYGIYNAANAYYPEYRYVKENGKYSSLELIDTEEKRTTSQFTKPSSFVEKANTHDKPILGITPRWELPQCTFSSFYIDGAGMARKHFSPLWWKDGPYTIVCDATELWTPAGMIGAEAVAHSGEGGDVYINGSVYDDYYTSRG